MWRNPDLITNKLEDDENEYIDLNYLTPLFGKKFKNKNEYDAYQLILHIFNMVIGETLSIDLLN